MSIVNIASNNSFHTFNIFGEDISLPVNLELASPTNRVGKYHLEYIGRQELTAYLSSNKEKIFVFEDEITIVTLTAHKYLVHFDWNRPTWQIHFFILKIAIPYILSQVGYGFLHASTVANNNLAISFVGHQQSGKSTIARYFIENSFSLISDDICGFKKCENDIFVYNAENKQRLREESYLYYLKNYAQENIQNSVTTNERLIDGTLDTRYICKANNKFSHSILKNIFILKNSDCLECFDLNKNDAFKELIVHFSNTVKRNFSNESFQRLHELTNLSQISILYYPKNLELLPDIYRLVTNKIS